MSAASIPSVDFKCVTMVSQSLAFAGGSQGTIIKSVDGGDTWNTVRSGGTKTFTGIAFWDASNGIAVTRDRAVWGTDDGGDTWTEQNPDMTDVQQETLGRRQRARRGTRVARRTACLAGGSVSRSDSFEVGEQVWRTSTGGVYWGPEPLPYSGKWYNEPMTVSGTPYWVGKGEFLVDRLWHVDSRLGRGNRLLSTAVHADSRPDVPPSTRPRTVAARGTGRPSAAPVGPDRSLVRGRERRRDHELRWSHLPHLERRIRRG